MSNPARRRMLEYVQLVDTPHLLDLGSGTGSSVIHFARLLDRSFSITLVEREQETSERIIPFLEQNLNDFIYDHTSGEFRRGDQVITLTIVNTDITSIAQDLELDTFDLVSANAVFDLFTKDEFIKVISQLEGRSIYFTINYCGSSIVHPTLEPASMKYLHHYDEHMKREQPQGSAMGPDCCTIMLDVLQDTYKEVITGRSDWEFSSGERVMIDHLLRYMSDALPDILDEEQIRSFQSWKSKILNQVDQVIWYTQHMDFFAHSTELLPTFTPPRKW
jgi:hypothetical protein